MPCLFSPSSPLLHALRRGFGCLCFSFVLLFFSVRVFVLERYDTTNAFPCRKEAGGNSPAYNPQLVVWFFCLVEVKAAEREMFFLWGTNPSYNGGRASFAVSVCESALGSALIAALCQKVLGGCVVVEQPRPLAGLASAKLATGLLADGVDALLALCRIYERECKKG